MTTIDIQLRGRLGLFDIDVAFQAPMHGITALFGPSGCGKTSILRSVAGLQTVAGRIAIGADIWQDATHFRPPHKRPIGYVFQEPSLFQHLSVRQNLVYGQKRAKGNTQTIRLDDVVDLLGLGQLIDRDPSHLSGGERQRVSIGRALLSQPRLLLMDEPLSALDRMAKDEILPYFEALHASLAMPILLVSHDITEVERLADHMVALKKGRVVSSGPLNDTLTEPSSPFGQSRQLASILPATVTRIDGDGIVALDVSGTEILCIANAIDVGQKMRVRIAASDVSIAHQPHAATSILNAVATTVVRIEAVGHAEANVGLAFHNGDTVDFIARLSQRSVKALSLRVGQQVIAQIKGVSLMANR